MDFIFEQYLYEIQRRANKIIKMVNSSEAALMDVGVEMAGFMIVIALVFFPVGYVAFKGINKTAMGITTGSSEDTIINAIGTISLVVLIMTAIGRFKRSD